TAEAPADQRYLAPGRIVHLFQEVGDCVLHAVSKAEVAPLLPAAHGVAAVTEEGTERPGRRVGGDQPRKHQDRMAVAARRQRKERKCAKEGAELGKEAPLHKHQGPGRGAKRLRGIRRHLVSFDCPALTIGPWAGSWPTVESFRNATSLIRK